MRNIYAHVCHVHHMGVCVYVIVRVCMYAHIILKGQRSFTGACVCVCVCTLYMYVVHSKYTDGVYEPF